MIGLRVDPHFAWLWTVPARERKWRRKRRKRRWERFGKGRGEGGFLRVMGVGVKWVRVGGGLRDGSLGFCMATMGVSVNWGRGVRGERGAGGGGPV